MGHNPRQHGRPSHHPLLAVLPEAHFILPGRATQRRFVVIDERVRESRPSLGSKLIEGPGDPFRIFVTSLDGPPEEIWRECGGLDCVVLRLPLAMAPAIQQPWLLRPSKNDWPTAPLIVMELKPPSCPRAWAERPRMSNPNRGPVTEN
jgi:hypothetical protein